MGEAERRKKSATKKNKKKCKNWCGNIAGLIKERKNKLIKEQRGTWERRVDRVQSGSEMSY